MKLNWRAWHALATREAVDKGNNVRAKKVAPIPRKYLKAVKPHLRNPHTDGPHSTN